MINKKDLIAAEQKRLVVRDSYKRSTNRMAESLGVTSYVVYIPKIHISKTNDQLNKGLSWLYNGFVIQAGNVCMVVDPGVHFLYRLTEDNFNLSQINALFISHAHLDHSSDANALMDWLIRAQTTVTLYAPESVFTTHAVSDFHSGRANFPLNWLPKHSSLSVNKLKKVQLSKDVNVEFFQLHHSVECYGLNFFVNINDKQKKISYISDTGYAKTLITDELSTEINVGDVTIPTVATINRKHLDIKNHITNADLLIVNIDSFLHGKNSKTHLSVIDLLDLVSESGVEKILITHINPLGELSYDQWGHKIAQFIEQETKIPTVCPSEDGITLEFNRGNI